MLRPLCAVLLLIALLAGCETAAPATPTPIPPLPTVPPPTLVPPTSVPPTPPVATPTPATSLSLTPPQSIPSATATRPLPPLSAIQGGISVPVWWHDAYSSPTCDAAWEQIAALGATWVAVVPTWYQAGGQSSTIGPETDRRSASEGSVRHAIAAAHAAGLRVLLKPHVDASDDSWRGLFRPGDPPAWFASYTAFITYWARIAAEEHADLFSVGTELATLSGPAYTAQWRSIVAAVRASYPGPLTYAANWGKRPSDAEYQQIGWWDALDYIGIDAYFPLSTASAPSATDLLAGWDTYRDPWGDTYHWKAAISAVQARWARPVLFTEVGYASTPHGPASWDAPTPPPGPTPSPAADPAVQAAAYNALIATWADVPWFAGFYAWQWYPIPGAGGPHDPTMLLNDKPTVLDTLQAGFVLLRR